MRSRIIVLVPACVLERYAENRCLIRLPEIQRAHLAHSIHSKPINTTTNRFKPAIFLCIGTDKIRKITEFCPITLYLLDRVQVNTETGQSNASTGR